MRDFGIFGWRGGEIDDSGDEGGERLMRRGGEIGNLSPPSENLSPPSWGKNEISHPLRRAKTKSLTPFRPISHPLRRIKHEINSLFLVRNWHLIWISFGFSPRIFHMFFNGSRSQRGFAADFQRNFHFFSSGSIFSKWDRKLFFRKISHNQKKKPTFFLRVSKLNVKGTAKPHCWLVSLKNAYWNSTKFIEYYVN